MYILDIFKNNLYSPSIVFLFVISINISYFNFFKRDNFLMHLLKRQHMVQKKHLKNSSIFLLAIFVTLGKCLLGKCLVGNLPIWESA